MSTKRSIYEELIIESNDGVRTVDIRLGTASIDYYEDVFSPTITAKIVVASTGNAIKGKDGKLQSIYDGLPLRGGERVSIKIAGNSATNKGLDFATNPKDYLYVSSISNVIKQGLKEIFVINLVSREAITNETTRVQKKYPTSLPISESVRDIVQKKLLVDKPVDIDTTSNKYGFIGNLRKPFTVLVWLASKAVPASSGNATAGFFFFQTKEGYKFKSIDGLITQSPKQTYEYSEVAKNQIERNNDFDILSYSIERNQNLLEKLRLGTYSSFRAAFNPLNCTFSLPSKGKFSLKDYVGKTKNLGREPELPRISDNSNTTLGELPSRILSYVVDIGTMDPGVSISPNADPYRYQSQSIMRYNLLFTQIVNMTVPLNTNLQAGDIIECKFPKITSDKAKTYDEEESGLYMIKELCHHFDSDISLTSMKLVRDTYGQYGTNNQQQ